MSVFGLVFKSVQT